MRTHVLMISAALAVLALTAPQGAAGVRLGAQPEGGMLRATPEAVGMSSERLQSATALLRQFVADRKIAGAAQRRTKGGLLIQGSIQPPSSVRRVAWEDAFVQVAGATWQPLTLNHAFETRVRELAANKYASERYNQRR